MKSVYDSKPMRVLLCAKKLWLMYFAGGTFVCLLVDWAVTRAGMIPTALLWQILLASLICTALHLLVYAEDAAPTIRRVALHVALTYALMLLLAVMFHWMPLTPLAWAIFTGVFLLIYAGLFLGFSILYRIEKGKLNEQLAAYRDAQK